jgi:hypothetical protein
MQLPTAGRSACARGQSGSWAGRRPPRRGEPSREVAGRLVAGGSSKRPGRRGGGRAIGGRRGHWQRRIRVHWDGKGDRERGGRGGACALVSRVAQEL